MRVINTIQIHENYVDLVDAWWDTNVDHSQQVDKSPKLDPSSFCLGFL